MVRLVLSTAAMLVLGACSGGPGSTHAPPCPEGALDQPARADAIVARLASVPEGAAIVESARARVARICFGSGASVIDDERTVLLDRALSEGEAASRLGHLMMHARDGSPYQPGSDCEVVVARALDAEARAHAVELALRRALSVRGEALVYELEPVFWETPERDRVALVRAWLESHPDGGGGFDALGAGYRERCERDRAD
ncbi:MAG: hypothetical protein M3Y87_32215 [Myxococcota bacterium]|nr:hypothetical protein [Myxococcota bacterium]